MKRPTAIILIILFGANCAAQSLQDSVKSLFTSTSTFSVLKKVFKPKGLNKYDYKHDGQMDFGFRYYRHHLLVEENFFYIIAVGKSDSIHSLNVLARRHDGDKKDWIYDTLINWTDSLFLERYVTEHNLLYKTNFLKDDFGKSDCGIFGAACGAIPRPQESFFEMSKLVYAKDFDKLRRWSISLCPEDRIHGTIGLYFLKKKGAKLSDEDEQIIRKNQNSKSIVNFCSGCTEGYQSIKELTTQKEMERYYTWYDELRVQKNIR